MIEPDGSLCPRDLIAQIHATTKGPTHLDLTDGPRFEADQRDGVILCCDGMDERVAPAHYLYGAILLAHEVPDDLHTVASHVDHRTTAGAFHFLELVRMGARIGLS